MKKPKTKKEVIKPVKDNSNIITISECVEAFGKYINFLRKMTSYTPIKNIKK